MTLPDRAHARSLAMPGRPWRALALALSALALLGFTSCNGDGPGAQLPRALSCQEVSEGAPGPTLVCQSRSGEVDVRIPWQGEDLKAWEWSLGDYGDLPEQQGFRPISDSPVILLSITRSGTYDPLRTFDPPISVSVNYGSREFAAANPTVGEGELGLGVWDPSNERWVVVGRAVFHEGFWLADPVAGHGLELVTDAINALPRYQMSGDPGGGEATGRIGVSLPTLPLAWGAVPYDTQRMLKDFDGPCEYAVLNDVPAVECVSEEVGVTVRVPYQEYGTVEPRVIALPWNRAETFIPTAVGDQYDVGAGVVELERSLMNFLVVDAADPARVIFDFDPPMEFEVEYAPEDKDPDREPVLRLTYWDEYAERFVVLGEGLTSACIDPSGRPNPGCTWGDPVAAEPTSDPLFNGRFFRGDDAATGGGVAKFTYHRWGDRMVMVAR